MHFRVLPHGVNEVLPLIYMWEVHASDGTLLGRYVGKAKAGAKRPRFHYSRNVANILQGKPYRKGNPNGYRRVHVALADAAMNGHQISLQFIRNVQPHEDINEVERMYIKVYGCAGAEGWQLNR